MNNVAQIIETIRDIARNAAEIDAELDKRHAIDGSLGTDYFDPKAIARRQEINAAEVEMEKYLSALDTETLGRIEAVMYSGRDNEPAVDKRDELRANNPTKEDVVRTIMEKRASFDPYFDRGLDRAKADGIDLDAF